MPLLVTVLCFLAFSSSRTPVPRPAMERLRQLGINQNAPTSEFRPALISQPLDTLLSIRVELFSFATTSGLVTAEDTLVSRRETRLSPLRHKLADDIISLLLCLKNNSRVPRSLLKNGTRCASYLESSRQSSSQTSSQPSEHSEPAPSQTNPSESGSPSLLSHAPLTVQPNDPFRLSLLMKDMNLLRNDVEILKQEISRLHRNQPPTAIDSCHVKVFFPSPNTLVFEPATVSNLLGCPSMQVPKVY